MRKIKPRHHPAGNVNGEGDPRSPYGHPISFIDNYQADYICQFFFKGVASGASTGRAALQARQQFVKVASPPDPSDIKTLAQFNLYGDPSITPVLVPQAYTLSVAIAKKGKAATKSTFEADRVERKDRRRQLYKSGMSIAETEVVPRRTKRQVTRGVAKSMREIARKLGWDDEGEMLSFSLLHPPVSKSMLPKSMNSQPEVPTAYHVLFRKPSARHTVSAVCKNSSARLRQDYSAKAARASTRQSIWTPGRSPTYSGDREAILSMIRSCLSWSVR